MSKKLKGDLILLTAAIIWGFAFVAQKAGMDYIGPFTYNGIRFFMGATVLLPLLYYQVRKDRSIIKNVNKKVFWSSILAGLILFVAVSLQQSGIVYTTSGNAGFITGLYIIFVPFIGYFLKHKIRLNNWLGAIIALIGLYFLSITSGFRMQKGDILVLLCAFFWTIHILIIARLTLTANSIVISCIQFYVCAILCSISAVAFETVSMHNITDATIPILYGGLLSIPVAYTLQVVGQKFTPPSEASIILSLEALFAAIGGWLILNEVFTFRSILGCLLMLAGIIISQMTFKKRLYS
jgi:drug/metabolite transporter (DMT)-like permease